MSIKREITAFSSKAEELAFELECINAGKLPANPDIIRAAKVMFKGRGAEVADVAVVALLCEAVRATKDAEAAKAVFARAGDTEAARDAEAAMFLNVDRAAAAISAVEDIEFSIAADEALKKNALREEWLQRKLNENNAIPVMIQRANASAPPKSLEFPKTPERKPKTVQGVTKAEITAIDWPLVGQRKSESLARALGDVSETRCKWLLPARVSRGRAGKGSHLWNPARLAFCLCSHDWIVNKARLQKKLEEHFSDYLDEWEELKEKLG